MFQCKIYFYALDNKSKSGNVTPVYSGLHTFTLHEEVPQFEKGGDKQSLKASRASVHAPSGGLEPG